MEYPSMDQVEQADRETIYQWFLLLPAPGMVRMGKGKNSVFVESPPGGKKIFRRIYERWKELGGRDGEISERILKEVQKG